MSLQGLVDLLRQSKEVEYAAKQGQIITGLSGGQRSVFLSTIYSPHKVMLVVTASQVQAERLASDLAGLLPEAKVLVWESHELMPHEEAPTALDLRWSRLEVLQEGRTPGAIILAPVTGLLEGLLAPERLLNSEISINMDSRLDLDYRVDHGFSHEDVEVLKSGSLDAIIPLFVKADLPLVTKYLSLAIRSIVRFINNQPLLGKLEKVSTYSFGNLAFQETTGDHDLWLGLGCQEDELTEVASPFAKESFPQMNDDAFDSVCEFINCINGLFSTELSFKGLVLDMKPPVFAQNQTLKGDADLYILPIKLNGKQIDLIAHIAGKVEIL